MTPHGFRRDQRLDRDVFCESLPRARSTARTMSSVPDPACDADAQTLHSLTFSSVDMPSLMPFFAIGIVRTAGSTSEECVSGATAMMLPPRWAPA